jgi:hypothetical protein
MTGSSKKRGFSIRIILPEGSPDGLRIVEEPNWTGCGVVCPRSLFNEVKCRPEFARAGVYVLLGLPNESELRQVYAGEGAPIRLRLVQPMETKDFWTSLICFTSKDSNLNKAHVQYLESRLLELAREAKRCDLENANSPQLPSVSEADVAEIEGFFDEMLLCFPVLGISVFEKPEAQTPQSILLILMAKAIQGSGYDAPQGFVVNRGSEAVREEVPSIHRYLSELRESLVKHGILEVQNGKYRFAQGYVFDSPSTAAGVLLRRSANGRIEWKTKEGRTLKELQEIVMIA